MIEEDVMARTDTTLDHDLQCLGSLDPKQFRESTRPRRVDLAFDRTDPQQPSHGDIDVANLAQQTLVPRDWTERRTEPFGVKCSTKGPQIRSDAPKLDSAVVNASGGDRNGELFFDVEKATR